MKTLILVLVIALLVGGWIVYTIEYAAHRFAKAIKKELKNE